MVSLIQDFEAAFPQKVGLKILNSVESRPQNPEFRNDPENFHPCIYTATRPHGHYRQGCTLYTPGCRMKAYNLSNHFKLNYRTLVKSV